MALVVDDAEEEKKIAIELEINKEVESRTVNSKPVNQHIVEPKETIFRSFKKSTM